MFRWLRRREGKRIAAEVGEPAENSGVELPDQIAELIRILGEGPAVSVKKTAKKPKAPTFARRRHPGRR